MDGVAWCGVANKTRPDVVRQVHEDYIRAGADVFTANTFATCRHVLAGAGFGDETVAINRRAVELACEARDRVAADRPIAVAGSMSTMQAWVPGTVSADPCHAPKPVQESANFREMANTLADAGAGLIIMEMMRDCDYSVWATEAAVATGLPVWVGIAVERRADGRLVGFGRQDWTLEDIVAALMGTGALACLIMHNEIDLTAEALEVVTSQWAGPLGAYPESGYFEMPEWQFVDIIDPDGFAARCLQWRRQGAAILGGCCGIGPEHIAALAAALKGET
jgi:homocysteine S-methyltransferase